jgi:hypothetical protein
MKSRSNASSRPLTPQKVTFRLETSETLKPIEREVKWQPITSCLTYGFMSSSKQKSVISKPGKASELSFEFPPPMSPQYLNRSLVQPWRRKNEVAPTAGLTPSTVLWTHLEQNMFELQITAAENETHPKTEMSVDDPYPQ